MGVVVTRLPLDALDSDIAILGRKGGGKTFTAKGIVEQLLDMGRRVLVLDPLGVWVGLRTAADGERPGYPVAIFGGLHADLPLDTAAAGPLAEIIAHENLPAVIDLSELSKHAQQVFLLAFLHQLRLSNRDALTIVLEEADVFAPQNPLGDDSKALHGEIDWIARRGRFRGFRLITITQRPARLSKDVLTQSATLIAHRLPSPQDRDAVKAWVEGNGDKDKAREVFDTLAGLAVGEAWVWAPEQSILERMRFPRIKTLDTSATPKAGEQRIEPKTLAEVDLSAIRMALLVAQEAEQPDPKKPGNRQPDRAEIDAAERRGYERGLAEGESRGFGRGQSAMLVEVQKAIGTLRAEDGTVAPSTTGVLMVKPRRAAVAASPAAEAPAGSLNGAARKMLAVLDTNPPVRRSWQQVATLAGLKARGGHFNAGRKALIDGGYIIDHGDLIEHGNPSPGARAPADDPAAMVELWAGALSGAAPKLLRFLFESGGDHPREDIAFHLGMQPRGGHWNSAWKELRDNGIITIDGDVARLTDLFHPRARDRAMKEIGNA